MRLHNEGINLHNKFCKKNKINNMVMIGDNLDCLNRILENKIKTDVIYIDPPYNTGNKFSYNDKRTSDYWGLFLSKRLILAKEILKEDGVIFISIDDSSLYELKLICDNIFKKDNFLGLFITKQAIRSNSNHINTIHEYVIAYAKNKKKLHEFKIKRIECPNDRQMIQDISIKVAKEFKSSGIKAAEKLLYNLNNEYMAKRNITWVRNYSHVDEKGEIFFPKDLSVPGKPSTLIIDEIGLKLPALKTRKWSSSKKITNLYNDNKLFFKGNRPYEKHYLKDSYDNVSSILDFYSRQGTNDLNKLGLRGLFDTPKPVELIKYLIRIATNKKNNALICDFFAGSGTTAQAVMEINIEDKKNHNFYLIQLDENIAKNTAQCEFAKKNGIKPTVDQLMIYRIKTVIEKLEYKTDFKIIKIKKTVSPKTYESIFSENSKSVWQTI